MNANLLDNVFIVAGFISVVFVLIKFLEIKFFSHKKSINNGDDDDEDVDNIDEPKHPPLKHIVRDTILVYFSVVIGVFLIEQINPLNEMTEKMFSTPKAFLSEPDF